MGDYSPKMRNDAAPWSDFDADGYAKVNYATVLPEDAEIVRFATSFLIRACGAHPATRRAVDVGAGPNLYPALLMLPWARQIVFTEYAQTNIDWLTRNLTDAPGEWAWQPFWDLMACQPGYENVARPRQRLAAQHDIVKVSVFDLPANTWDLGSMFFVADGISSDEAEFEAAVRRFLGALTPGSPFMMAFMEGSAGYDVSGVHFPGVKITQNSLAELVAALPVDDVSVLRTDNTVRPLRSGYDAMLLLTGHLTDRPGERP
jgi:NNMT/PNMT/TEMT family